MVEAEPFIEVRNLEFAYRLPDGGVLPALRGINLRVARGEFVALIGANGSGKSTLARHFNALLPGRRPDGLPTSGQVWVDGFLTSDPANLWAIRQRVGMVFQNPDNQIVANTVEEDVAFGPENLGVPPAEIRRRIDEALATVELLDYLHQPPAMLSGGQKQRVAIAGALAARSSCLILDEPTSMLDPAGRRQVLETVRRLNAQEGITVVLITHVMSEAAAADRVLVMDRGRIVMDGPPGVVFQDAERLHALRLNVPPVVEVAAHLRSLGLGVPRGALSVEDVVRALC